MSKSQVINIISVNTAPDRAKKVIGAVIEKVKDRYDLVHAGNAESEYVENLVTDGVLMGTYIAIEEVKPLLLSTKPPPKILVSH
jgi:hypothetical protein